MDISLRVIPFNNIVNNLKTIEVRLYRGIFTKIKINDIIKFTSNDRTITKKIKNIKLYNSFEELYNSENINNITPSIKSKECFINHYEDIYKNYNTKNHKVIALFI
jgi:ASC-1-like (ASCH) protein